MRRDTDKHRHTETKTRSHTDKHADTKRQINRHTQTEINAQTRRDTDTQTWRDTDKHRHAETDKHRPTDTQINADMQTQRDTDKQTNRCAETHADRHRHAETHGSNMGEASEQPGTRPREARVPRSLRLIITSFSPSGHLPACVSAYRDWTAVVAYSFSGLTGPESHKLELGALRNKTLEGIAALRFSPERQAFADPHSLVCAWRESLRRQATSTLQEKLNRSRSALRVLRRQKLDFKAHPGGGTLVNTSSAWDHERWQ